MLRYFFAPPTITLRPVDRDKWRAVVVLQVTPARQKLAAMVAAYEPAQGVVVCIANPAWEQWTALRLSNPLLPPPVAFRRAGQQAGVEIG